MKNIAENLPSVETALREILRPIVVEAVREALATHAAPAPSAPVFLSTDEAAERLGVHVATIQKLARRGELKAHRAGRCLRFRPEDLDAYAARGAR